MTPEHCDEPEIRAFQARYCAGRGLDTGRAGHDPGWPRLGNTASRPIPALFTAINKDTAELHHEPVPFDGALAQGMSDKGVRIIRATEAGELLPRIAQAPDFHECRFCPWADRFWRIET